MKIHCMAMVLVIIAGIILRLPAYKWCICLILFGLIMALELVNTAVEAVVDLVTEERKPLAKIAKDTAAGAVLIAAVMAAITGLILFVPEVLNFLAVDRFILYNKERCIMDGLGENVKKVLLAGIGAVAMTTEKSRDLLSEMVKKGELTVEQGKVLNEELKHNIKKTVKRKCKCFR